MLVTCDTCRFWSEMIAEAGGGDPRVRALCLNAQSPRPMQMVPEDFGCPKHEPGSAVDDPASPTMVELRHG